MKLSNEIKHRLQMAIVHRQLKQESGAHFEAQVAHHIGENCRDIAPSVQSVSINMLRWIIENNVKIITQLDEKPTLVKRIEDHLYNPTMFGHNKKTLHTCGISASQSVLKNIIAILASPSSSLWQIMQTHATVGYFLVNKLGYDTFIHAPWTTRRGHQLRDDRSKSPRPSRKIGFNRASFFNKKLRHAGIKHHKPHIRAVDRFKAKHSSRSIVPFAAGPSAHSLAFIHGMVYFQCSSHVAQQQYISAVFAFLVAGGNHSFSEVIQAVSCHANHQDYAARPDILNIRALSQRWQDIPRKLADDPEIFWQFMPPQLDRSQISFAAANNFNGVYR